MDTFFRMTYESRIKKDLLSNCKNMKVTRMRDKKVSDRFIPSRLSTCQSVNGFSMECELNKENHDELNIMMKE